MKKRVSIALLCFSVALSNALLSLPVKAADSIQGAEPYSATDFEAYLTEQGFPESYKTELRKLHDSYPNWIFEAQHTGLEWVEVVSAESTIGKNLVPGSSITSWKSTDEKVYNWETGEWAELDTGGWVAASPAIIEYYMDPRNFLDETYVFQFLKQSYNPQTETKEGIENMTVGTFLAGTYEEGQTQLYSDALIQAAQVSGVNPYVLASMIIMEQGRDGSGASISGKVKGYEGYYNYFNIGAYKTDSMSAVERGLWFAKGSGQDAVSYNRPWNTRTKSIIGGAEHYGENYVNQGQDTLYLKKFNVQGDNLYNHQYMTNVAGSASEGSIMSEAYTDALRTGNLTFKIPVYENMPEEVCQKPTGNETPVREEEQTKPDTDQTPESGGEGTNTDNTEGTGSVDSGSTEENNSNTGNNGNENINGNIELTGGEAKVGDTVTVKAEVSSEKAAISSYSISLIYDPQSLEFIPDDSQRGGVGAANLEGALEQAESTVELEAVFKVLKAGEHKIGISEARVLTADEVLLTMSSQAATVKGIQNAEVSGDETEGGLDTSGDSGTVPPQNGAGHTSDTSEKPQAPASGTPEQPNTSASGALEQSDASGTDISEKGNEATNTGNTSKDSAEKREGTGIQNKNSSVQYEEAEAPVTKDSNVSGILGIIGAVSAGSAVLIIIAVIAINAVSVRRERKEDSID